MSAKNKPRHCNISYMYLCLYDKKEAGVLTFIQEKHDFIYELSFSKLTKGSKHP